MKYRTPGINKNKKIREQRNKPLPAGLMKCSNSKNVDSPTKKSNSSAIYVNPLGLNA